MREQGSPRGLPCCVLYGLGWWEKAGAVAEEDGVGFGVDVGATDVDGAFHERIVEQFLHQRRFVFVAVEREQVEDLFIFRR